MRFIADAQIEARVGEIWRAHELEPAFDVERLLDRLDLRLCWEDVPDDDGQGDILGMLLPRQRTVYLNERHQARLERDGARQLRFTVGHEIGHWMLHSEGLGDGAVELVPDERVMCRDGSAARIELQAERFSGALLAPRDPLREALPAGEWAGWGPVYRLADRFVVTVSAMRVRLLQLGWIHLDESEVPHSGSPPPLGQASLLG